MARHVAIVTAMVCLAAMSIPDHVDGSYPRPEPLPQAPISDQCLQCICESSGPCTPPNKSIECTGSTCGMFGITLLYWIDANKPTISGKTAESDVDDYQLCTTEENCARTTVKNYLFKFAQDCNHDKVIDCEDYAAIHKLGGYNCDNVMPKTYRRRFYACKKKNRF